MEIISNKSVSEVFIPEGMNLNDLGIFKLTDAKSIIERKTLIHRDVERNVVLRPILDKIEVIDFAFENGGENVLAARQQYDPIKDKKFIERLENECMPKDDEKLVIIMDYLLHIAEENDRGLVANNAYYYLYNGTHWETIDVNLLRAFLSVVAEKSGIPKNKAWQHGMVTKLNNQFDTSAAFIEPDDDEDVVKINLLNGTFHINKILSREDSTIGVLKDPRMDDFLKYQLNFNYDPIAKAPLFEKFINRVLPDRNCQDILFEFIGYVFTDLKLEKTLILCGPGGNGKSVVFEVIKALLGESNLSYHTMDDLSDNKAYHRADIGRKLLNYQSEMSEIPKTELFKKLISGEPIDARTLYKPPFTLFKYCKFMFNANNLPKVEQTNAFFRRIIILPFTQTIPKDEVDIDLHNKIIKAELSGILNLVLEGLKRLLSQGRFTESNVVDEQLNAYKKDSNNVQLFLDDEGWEKSLTHKVPLKIFYQYYRDYCLSNGYLPLSRVKLTGRLETLGFHIGRNESQNSTNVYCQKIQREDISEVLGNTTIVESIINSFNHQ